MTSLLKTLLSIPISLRTKTQHLLLFYLSASPPPPSLPLLQPYCSLLVPECLGAKQCLFSVPGTLFHSIHKAQPLLILVRAQMSTSGRTSTTTSTFKLCSPTFLVLLSLPYSVPYHSSPNRLKCAHVPSVSSHQHIHSLKKGIFLSLVQIYLLAPRTEPDTQ